MYKCKCGKEFENSQSFNAHKSHCKVHQLAKYGNLDKLIETTSKRKLQRDKTISKNKEANEKESLSRWIAEEHKCEHCGKIMTEKFGSGRFCSRTCANSRKISNDQKAKTSKALIDYHKTHPLTEKQLAHSKLFGKHIRAARKYSQFTTCAYCGKIIDITGKKRNKTGRYYCDGICRNRHLNKIGEIGGLNQGLNTSKWEKDFQELLTKYHIKFEANKRDLLPSGLEVDIWLPELNTAIELNGIWHYSDRPYNGNIKKFNDRLLKDELKKKEAKQLGLNYYIFEDRNIKDTNKFFIEFIENNLLNS